ncbi:hypothetical protein UFOVP1382_65 [uncultured Caudovirales phage]|uniref:Uncharacterized protein n=1 Tax=uncultured Caudovirales phage TaxID=2100421 RepID=A0A6J5S4E7_9CAUD|nr:hypothetical protein UFOVP1382_65 [uncultured Caudovirales phage]
MVERLPRRLRYAVSGGAGLAAFRSKLKPGIDRVMERPGAKAAFAALAKIKTRSDLMPTSGPSEPHRIVESGESDNAVIARYAAEVRMGQPDVITARLHLAIKGQDMNRDEAEAMFGEAGTLAWDHNEGIRQRVRARWA